MPPRSYRVVEARDRQEASEHLAAWADLYARRLDDNLFLRPEFLLPLLGHACREHPVIVVFVYDDRERMVGVAVFDDVDDAAGPLGSRTGSSCTHPLLFEATPVLDRDVADHAARALWAWASAPERPWAVVRWARVRLDSACWRTLAAAIDRAESRWWARRIVRRPALAVPDSWDGYLAEIGRSRRKRLRRIERRFQKAGESSVRIHPAAGDVIDRFLRLEKAGWKGDEGTALACDPGQESFFREATALLADSGAGYYLELLLDDRPVAVTINFVEGGRLYAYKTAYDPEHARLSPGIAVEAELVRALVDDDAVRVIDSCAQEDSHVAGLWGDRLPFGEIVCSTGMLSALSVGAAPRLSRSRDRVRELWRSVSAT